MSLPNDKLNTTRFSVLDISLYIQNTLNFVNGKNAKFTIKYTYLWNSTLKVQGYVVYVVIFSLVSDVYFSQNLCNL